MSAVWVDDVDTGFGSVTWSALTATHTNRREWSRRVDFDAARARAREAGRRTFEQILSMIDAGMLPSAAVPLFALPLGPLVDRALTAGDGANGSHGTDFAPGVRVAWIGSVGVLNVGRVRRVQTLWADRCLVHVDQVDRGPNVSRAALLAALRMVPGMTAARAAAQADRMVLSADQLFRVADDADPFAWQDSLLTPDGWDMAAVREFVVAQMARLAL